MPEVVVETKPVETEVKGNEVTAEVKQEVKPQEDLVTRASRVSIDKPKTEATNPFGLTKEDYDKVQQDPVLSKFYKSMQSDYSKKTAEVADLRKTFESKSQEINNWTPQRVQELLNNKDFVNSAQSILQSQAPETWKGSQDEWSALNDKEKHEFSLLKQEMSQLKMQSAIEQQKRQDDTLKQRYANYDPNAVDIITSDLLSGKARATREELWKVYDYENAVKRAYELGKQDRNVDITDKSNASAYDGMQVNSPQHVEAPKQGESNQAAIKRIFLENIAKFKGRNI